MSIITRSFVKANKNDRLNKIACKSGTELALHTPSKSCFALCGQLVVCQDFFSWKDMPSFQDLMTDKNSTGSNLPENHY